MINFILFALFVAWGVYRANHWYEKGYGEGYLAGGKAMLKSIEDSGHYLAEKSQPQPN